MRSLLIAPGDDEARLAAALRSEADAVAIDLDVAPAARGAARAAAARVLKAQGQNGRPAPMVRLSALADGESDLDLDAVVGLAPAAILLPGMLGGASVQRLSARLAVREADNGLEHGSMRIIAVVDTAAALLNLASLRDCSARLVGLAWDAAGFAADIGAEPGRDARGAAPGPCRLARDLTLIGAAAAGVAAIDAGFLSADPEGLRAEALAARRDGFSAKIALDPDHARIINRVFETRG